MHLMHVPYLHFCPSSDSETAPMSTSGLNKQSRDFDHTHPCNSQVAAYVHLGEGPWLVYFAHVQSLNILLYRHCVLLFCVVQYP